jgi:hypothetical protein
VPLRDHQKLLEAVARLTTACPLPPLCSTARLGSSDVALVLSRKLPVRTLARAFAGAILLTMPLDRPFWTAVLLSPPLPSPFLGIALWIVASPIP